MGREQNDEILNLTGTTVANATNIATMDPANGGTALAPAAVTVSTVSKWLKIVESGTEYYIPLWT